MPRFVRKSSLVLFIVGVVAAGWLSLTPRDALPSIEVWDKLQHFAAYTCLALSGSWAFSSGAPPWRLAVGLVAYGIALEALQALVPGRVPSFGDAGANMIGVIFGWVVALLTHRCRRRSGQAAV